MSLSSPSSIGGDILHSDNFAEAIVEKLKQQVKILNKENEKLKNDIQRLKEQNSKLNICNQQISEYELQIRLLKDTNNELSQQNQKLLSENHYFRSMNNEIRASATSRNYGDPNYNKTNDIINKLLESHKIELDIRDKMIMKLQKEKEPVCSHKSKYHFHLMLNIFLSFIKLLFM